MNKALPGISSALKPRVNDSSRTGAFTLIELVSILTLLALLASLLAFAVAHAQPSGSSVQCLNNFRLLGRAWRMYAEDNQDRLVYNHEGYAAGQAAGSETWAGGYMDFTSSSSNTNSELFLNHARYPYAAFLGPYLRSPRPFKCPADKSTVMMPGGRMPRVRSVSMNNCFGDAPASSPRVPGPPLFTNLTAIPRTSPAAILFVFVDELEESINDGVFAVDISTLWQLVDIPTARHNGGASFAFADGHSEIHRWRDRRTVPFLSPGQPLTLNINVPFDVDVQWIQYHAGAVNLYPGN